MDKPQLKDVAPELITELQCLLLKAGEGALVNQVAELVLIDRCRCGDSFCGTFYTAPKPVGSFGPGHRTIALWPEDGMLNIDVVGPKIVQVEVLYRDDFRDKLHAAIS